MYLFVKKGACLPFLWVLEGFSRFFWTFSAFA